MSIIDEIWFWVHNDTMDFILTVFVLILFFEGILPVWYDRFKDNFDNKK